MQNKALVLILTSIFIVLSCAGGAYWYLHGFKTTKSEVLSESKAIEIVKNQFSELKEYPSNKLAPKSIKTEKASDGWYLAFIQEGSGVLIIDAKCFLVKNDNSVTQIKYAPLDNGSIGEFSAKECRLVENVVGGDRDEHGCIGSAGYSWCQEKQKCLRVWEESCGGNAGSSNCALATCHGLDIQCGSNPPNICTDIYMVGDKCLKYAKCGVRNGSCQQIQNPQFLQCKSCVQKCVNANKNNNVKLFECENQCN